MEVTVRSGDSFSYYSRLFSLSLKQLIDANHGDGELKAGTVIMIPHYELIPYAYQKNDTFWGIARYHQIPIDLFVLVNQQVIPTELNEGDIIYLPKGATSLR